jgi:hypothetical protein
VVPAHHRHSVASFETVLAQALGEGRRSAVHLLEGEGPRLVDDGRKIRVSNGVSRVARGGADPPAPKRSDHRDQLVGPNRTKQAQLTERPQGIDRIAEEPAKRSH